MLIIFRTSRLICASETCPRPSRRRPRPGPLGGPRRHAPPPPPPPPRRPRRPRDRRPRPRGRPAASFPRSRSGPGSRPSGRPRNSHASGYSHGFRFSSWSLSRYVRAAAAARYRLTREDVGGAMEGRTARYRRAGRRAKGPSDTRAVSRRTRRGPDRGVTPARAVCPASAAPGSPALGSPLTCGSRCVPGRLPLKAPVSSSPDSVRRTGRFLLSGPTDPPSTTADRPLAPASGRPRALSPPRRPRPRLRPAPPLSSRAATKRGVPKGRSS